MMLLPNKAIYQLSGKLEQRSREGNGKEACFGLLAAVLQKVLCFPLTRFDVIKVHMS